MVTLMVTPTEYSGKDIHPFNTFSLECSATKPSQVIPPIQLSWYHDGAELDGSVSGVGILEEARSVDERSSTLSITPARVANSGVYTCGVEISIPESSAVSANQTATVTITGNSVTVCQLMSTLHMLHRVL